MSLLQVAHGALSLRGFVWPPQSIALVDELAAQARLFSALAPTVPRGRLVPHPPTSTGGIIATVFRDENRSLLIVVNRTHQTLAGRVDLRGLMDQVPVMRLSGNAPVVVVDDTLMDSWAPFQGHVYQWAPAN